jgi:hypothetical protein
MTAAGKRAEFWVIGMGKLGARELNVSSDIDLIYVYDEDGETTGNDQGLGKISVQSYFTRAVRAIYTLIGDTTEHGFVFRVDLALRPNGNSGPSVVSLGALARVGAFCMDEKPRHCPAQQPCQWLCRQLAGRDFALCLQTLSGLQRV